MNKHLKNWKCLKGHCDVKGSAIEKMQKHGSLFRACTITKQVAMQMGVGELHEI